MTTAQRTDQELLDMMLARINEIERAAQLDADALDEWRKENEPLDIYAVGRHRGNGWVVTDVVIVLATGGPHIEIVHDVDMHSDVRGYWGGTLYEREIDWDAVETVYPISLIVNTAETA